MPTVARTIPSSPKTDFPRSRATTTIANRFSMREVAVPIITQKVPLAKRNPSGEAPNLARKGRNRLGQYILATQ